MFDACVYTGRSICHTQGLAEATASRAKVQMTMLHLI